MEEESIELEARYSLDENWKLRAPLPYVYSSQISRQRSDVVYLQSIFPENYEDFSSIVPNMVNSEGIDKVRIEVAKAADTIKLDSDDKYTYFLSKLGMNIILPKGSIEELRFKVSLKADGESTELPFVVIDGFPNDSIEYKHIGTEISIGLDSLLKFIPIPIPIPPGLVKFGPYKIRLGNWKNVKIDFSGGLTDSPEWYFSKKGVANKLDVSLTIKTLKNVDKLMGDVQAKWSYKPDSYGFVTIVSSDEKSVRLI